MPTDVETTLSAVLDARASRYSDRPALAYVSDIRSGDVVAELTYGQLANRARSLAARLLEQGAEPGQRVLLLFGSGPEFATAFFACVYAGLVAVPVPLPARSTSANDRLAGVLADCEPAIVLTGEANLADVRSWLPATCLPCVTVDPSGRYSPDDERSTPDTQLPVVEPDAVALLQYTSGSTSEPNGVMVTHRNLVTNLRLIHEHIGRDRSPRVCGWLPLTHDMGLIGQLLTPLFTGGWCLLLPPMEFLKRPYRWLTLIEEHACDVGVAPNFAFDLCVRKVTADQAATLDLSRWSTVVTGAEPIHAETLRRFADRFAVAGFDLAAILPSYGLAEATLLVSGKTPGQALTFTEIDPDVLEKGRFEPVEAGTGRTLVGCGVDLADAVRIVDPRSHRVLPECEVGEVWVTGDCVAAGYWERPELTAATFAARIADDDSTWLRTGDLGVRHAGQLYITGRIKDVIIIGGRNLYPQDIEIAVQNLGVGTDFDRAVAFGLDDDEIVVIQEVLGGGRSPGTDMPRTAAAVRRDLSSRFGVGPVSVVFVRPGGIQRTTSGKLRRSAMRRLFLEHGLKPLYQQLTPGMSERIS